MGKKEFFAIILAFFLIEPFFCAAIRINEMMYNPEGDDNNREFIEIYMDQYTNLSGWIIADSSSNDTLKLLQYNSENQNYALITEDGFNFSNINATIYSAGATIGNNLDNSADSVFLYDTNKTLVASASYDGSMANGNEKSLEYFDDMGWAESYDSGGTPGRENFRPILNETMNDTDNNATDNSTSTEECKAIIVAYTDKEEYNMTDKVNIHFALYNDSFPYTIEYWIEDSIGNIVKSRYNTTNTNTKTWTPELDEKDGVFYLKSNLYLDCGNGTRTGFSQSMFIVFNSIMEKRKDSYITIEEVYTGSDSKIEFGKILKVKAEIYKGDESSSTVDFWVENSEGEKISQTASALFYNKFTEYDVTIPVQLKPNCDKGYKYGNYRVVAEGLEIRDEEDVDVEGITSSMCPAISSGSAAKSIASAPSNTKSSGSAAAETKISYQLLNFKSKIAPKDEILNELLIQNDDETHIFDVWSYVYKGSKSYSGEREGNRQSIELSPHESAIVEMENLVDNAKAGDYNYKVKIKKDGQKTNYELTEDVEMMNLTRSGDVASPEGQGEVNDGLKKLLENRTGITGKVVYEGSTAKSKKLGLVLLIVSVFIVSLLGLRNWIGRKSPEKVQNMPIRGIKTEKTEKNFHNL